VLGPAADQARRLDHGWVGPEHYLLALLAESSVVTETLADLGVTYDRLVEDLRRQEGASVWPPPRSVAKGLSPNAAAYKLEARAEGLALAFGYRWPKPEHWLLAMIYDDSYGVAGRLHHLGATQPATLDALRRRGVRVPEVEPPLYRPWRGHHRVEVDEAELKPLIDLLIQQHPPGSPWRWGFNWLPGQPRRARVDSEEGIDLEQALAEARRQASS
jgi:Clp amino terminal domain, pathogenicity island component